MRNTLRLDGLTERQARARLDEAAERLRELGVILVRDNQSKVPKNDEKDYQDNFL